MIAKTLKITFIFLYFLPAISGVYGQNTIDGKQVEVALRMVGHQILLDANDSTSRVLPIIKEDKSYRISFDAEFDFEPANLVAAVDSIIRETGLVKSFIVEVEECETRETVYSFKVNELERSDIIPCLGRIQPKGCYSLLFTIISLKETNGLYTGSNLTLYISSIVLIGLLLMVLYLLRKKKRKLADPDLIPLGAYFFDKKNTELIIEHQRIELTSKEADLLLLLYNAANTTVERDVILNMIWGDEGNYVGRTLDVFISKLRKKLEFDAEVKIVNIRGVGYKLVMND